MRMGSKTPGWACHRHSSRDHTTKEPFDFTKKPSEILLQHGKPSPQLPRAGAMVFQSGNCERPGIRFAIEQKWFAAAKVGYSRTVNRFGEMPAGTMTVLD